MKYFALLTKLGENLLAQATALGTKIELTHMAVGDGGGKLPTPDTNQTKLVKEQRRAAINTLFIDEQNKNQIVAEQIIPEKDGGWWIREIGLFDKDGNLVAVANCPETYKPQLAEGSGRTQSIRMVLIVSHTESVTLKIDPSVVLATREFVDSSVQKGIEEHEKSRKHPDASTTVKGFVQLADTLSADNTKAITPKLATEINQRATNAQTTANTANTNATNANNNANGRVPSTRKVNNKPLSTDINLTASDVGAYDKSESDNRFQPKGNYLPSGYSYSKSESDNKYQQKGNYAPAGDYATNAALNNGLALKFDKTNISQTAGSSTVHVMSQDAATKYFQPKGDYLKVGDHGIGTKVGFYDVAALTPENPFGGTGATKMVSPPHNTAYQASIYWTQGGNLRLAGFTISPGGTKSAVSEFYSTTNAKTDHNGQLNVSSIAGLSDCKVGIPLPWPQATAPVGYLVCNGQSFNKAAYPLLAQAYPSGVLPDLRSEFIRGLDAGRNVDIGRAVLSAQSDTIQNITGSFKIHRAIVDSFSGAFSSGGDANRGNSTSGDDVGKIVNFNTSDSVRTSTETRPRNIAFLYIVRAA
uniref:Phage tail protein n=1 Tax=Providencia stuartii TaxID=588 RepID=A0AAI9GGY7_PROST|nr:phage tail protein [Providencia stuartii]